MTERVDRRRFLRRSLGAAAAAAAGGGAPYARAVDYPKPVPEAAGLTAYQNGATILLRWDNFPLLGYRAHPTLKYPYAYPLHGPASGLPLTSESALPYPHHRSLWLGCDPVNGGNYWADNELASGQIRSVQLRLEQDSLTKTSVAFRETCHWVREGAGSPFHDERRYVVRLINERVRTIDCHFVLTAQEPVEIRKAKHSLFAMRAAPDLSPAYGGVLLNSEGGVGAAGTYGKQAAWCGYHGRRRFCPDVVEGIAIMNHPDNFGGDCPWFTRDYGHLSPSPFNFLDKPFRMAKGEQLELKYRVVLHAGDPHEAELDAIYAQWLG